MEPVSLKKVFAVVVTCFAGGFLVNAKEPVVVETVSAADHVKAKFDLLLKKADVDKNGELSQSEIKGALDSTLINSFAQIDVNGDKSINAEEFASFLDSKLNN